MIGAIEMADILGVTPQTVRNLAKREKIPHLRVGKQYKFEPELVKAHLMGGSATNPDVADPDEWNAALKAKAEAE